MTPSLLANYDARPSRDFFLSGGVACRLMFRNEGLNSAMRFLLQFLRGVIPVSRITVFCVSKDLRNIMLIHDSDPHKTLQDQRVCKYGRDFTLVAEDQLEVPVIINDLTAIKEAVKDDADALTFPFFTQKPSCVCRSSSAAHCSF